MHSSESSLYVQLFFALGKNLGMQMNERGFPKPYSNPSKIHVEVGPDVSWIISA